MNGGKVKKKIKMVVIHCVAVPDTQKLDESAIAKTLMYAPDQYMDAVSEICLAVNNLTAAEISGYSDEYMDHSFRNLISVPDQGLFQSELCNEIAEDFVMNMDKLSSLSKGNALVFCQLMQVFCVAALRGGHVVFM